ncbi:hypothetical protein FSHL1_002999 [Fusarium sambucinum]
MALVYPACGLCKYRFEIDDQIVMHIRTSNRPYYGLRYNANNISSVDFDMNQTHKAYHFTCLDVFLPTSLNGENLDPDIWNATILQPTCETPIPSVRKRRTDWLFEHLVKKLERVVFNKDHIELPKEIILKIGRYAVREEAVAILKSLWEHKKEPPRDELVVQVDEASTLWIRYINIEGIQYIKSLSTDRPTEGGYKFFTFDKGYNIVRIFVASDRLGVRKIIINRPGEEPDIKRESGGLKLQQLRILEYHDQDVQFTVSGRLSTQELTHQDGTVSPGHGPRFCDILWSTVPNPLTTFPTFDIPIDRMQDYGQQLSNIVQYVDLNSPEATHGYSFCGYRDTLMEIIPDNGEQKNIPFDIAHTEGGRFPLWWMYMPLDEDERILTLWYRIYWRGETRCWSLVVRTDKRRSLLLGPHLEPVGNQNGTILHRAKLRLPTDRTSRAFWTNYRANQTSMCIENPSSLYLYTNETIPANPMPSEARYFLTSVELKNVEKVIPCRSWRTPKGPSKVMGLILVYKDKRRRSMGQVRHDCLESTMDVGSTEYMWIGVPNISEPHVNWTESGDGSRNQPGASSIHLSQPGVAEAPFRYLQVPWSGRLVWRFDSHQCHISHDEDPVEDELRRNRPPHGLRKTNPHRLTFGSTGVY